MGSLARYVSPMLTRQEERAFGRVIDERSLSSDL